MEAEDARALVRKARGGELYNRKYQRDPRGYLHKHKRQVQDCLPDRIPGRGCNNKRVNGPDQRVDDNRPHRRQTQNVEIQREQAWTDDILLRLIVRRHMNWRTELSDPRLSLSGSHWTSQFRFSILELRLQV